jgi:hypothetical protein
MRHALPAATAALFFGLSAASAGVLPANLDTVHASSVNRPHARAKEEGRAVASRAGTWIAPGAAYRRPADNGYHDPRFSLQQDEIYSQRF